MLLCRIPEFEAQILNHEEAEDTPCPPLPIYPVGKIPNVHASASRVTLVAGGIRVIELESSGFFFQAIFLFMHHNPETRFACLDTEFIAKWVWSEGAQRPRSEA